MVTFEWIVLFIILGLRPDLSEVLPPVQSTLPRLFLVEEAELSRLNL